MKASLSHEGKEKKQSMLQEVSVNLVRDRKTDPPIKEAVATSATSFVSFPFNSSAATVQ
jgi:hypothetical protein